ncbi:hypothetical protein [Roseateles sp. BYS96W]|uniref:Uncharacterized protein n=1 Tax=Pelomonas nitida TaxID=3299027 RepID=A0ABW7GAC4_9BURK
MSAELPVQSIAAIATVVAALIAGAIAFVNLTLTKEQKTSEFRQAWIDALREDLAQFLAAARAFTRAIEALHTLGPDYDTKYPLNISASKISELRYQAAETFSRIQLRLNPDEPEHVELLRLLRRAIDEQNAALAAKATDIGPTMRAIEAATSYAQPVLKREWTRVKRGELPFRVARNWVAPIIVMLSVAFVLFLLAGKFKI